MCIDFDGHHSDGSSFVYVNDFCYYRNCLYTHRYKFISEKKTGKESQYIVSRPKPGSDPPFRSDRESGCDNEGVPSLFKMVYKMDVQSSNCFYKISMFKRNGVNAHVEAYSKILSL